MSDQLDDTNFSSQTEKEMFEAIKILQGFDPSLAKEVSKQINNSPIFIFGMGSSLLFPGSNAKRRSFQLIPERRVEVSCPDLVLIDNMPQDSFVIIVSNSGETYEILQAVERLQKRNIQVFGITSKENSTLAKSCQRGIYKLQGEFEKGVAATKSVVDQALFLDALIHYLAQDKEFPLGIGGELTDKLAQQMKKNFYYKISKIILDAASIADTYYWIGASTGLENELKLKSIEIVRKRAIYESHTQFLHGHGETVCPKDLIIIVGYDDYIEQDKKKFTKLTKELSASILTIETQNDGHQHLNAEVIPDYENYSRLVAGWNFLRKVAHKLEIDIDNPRVAKKCRLE